MSRNEAPSRETQMIHRVGVRICLLLDCVRVLSKELFGSQGIMSNLRKEGYTRVAYKVLLFHRMCVLTGRGLEIIECWRNKVTFSLKEWDQQECAFASHMSSEQNMARDHLKTGMIMAFRLRLSALLLLSPLYFASKC